MSLLCSMRIRSFYSNPSDLINKTFLLNGFLVLKGKWNSYCADAWTARVRVTIFAPQAILKNPRLLCFKYKKNLNYKQTTYPVSCKSVTVAIRVQDGNKVPVQVVNVLRMGGVVLNQFVDQPGHECRRDPLASVHAFI